MNFLDRDGLVKLWAKTKELINNNKLTAGKGIDITDNTISCTLDTTVFKIVTSLPTAPASGDENKIHLVPNSEGQDNNVYIEYLYVNNKWEKLGEWEPKVDLTPYITKEEVEETYAKQNGTYPELTAGNAQNMEGNFEIESSSVYKPTGGDTSVASGWQAASIQNIKGNAIAWNQLINPIDESVDFNNEVNLSFKDKKFTLKGTVSVSGGRNILVFNKTPINIPTGHIVFLKRKVDKTQSGTIAFYLSSITNAVYDYIGFGGASDSLRFITIPSQIGGTDCHLGVNVTGDVEYTSEILLFDLTLIYGAGNEPTTPEQFEEDYQKWFGKSLTYEEYDEGSIRSVKATGIKTVGFNLTSINEIECRIDSSDWFNKILFINNCGYIGTFNIHADFEVLDPLEYLDKSPYPTIKVLYTDGTQSTCTIRQTIPNKIGTIVGITDTDKVVSKIIGVYANPSICRISNICINFVWSGSRNGDYEPHWEETKSLPITTLKGKLDGEGESVTIFPDGLKRAGNVYDEIVVENGVTKAIKRVGSVDLGTLDWIYEGLDKQEAYRYTGHAVINFPIKILEGTNQWNTAQYITSKLPIGLPYNKDTNLVGIYTGNTAKTIAVCIPSVTNKEDLQAYMQSVIMYYELEEPQEYIIDNFSLPLAYRIDDFGTEQIIMPENSIAPVINTKYGLNAVDTLRNLPSKFEEVNNSIEEVKKGLTNDIENNYWSKRELEVGGRNYVLNSKHIIDPQSNYLCGQYYISEKIEDGEIVTITIKAKLIEGKTHLAVYTDAASGTLGDIKSIGDNLYRLTTKWNNFSGWRNYIILYAFPNISGNAQLNEIEWIKIEKGTIPTDWTPAPEDLLNKSDEWYGTQSEYDALGTYDDNIKYYIYEDATPTTLENKEVTKVEVPNFTPSQVEDAEVIDETDKTE